MGNGKGFVVAGLVASWLEGVANKHGLLIFVNRLAYDGHDEDTEYHHHRQENPVKDIRKIKKDLTK